MNVLPFLVLGGGVLAAVVLSSQKKPESEPDFGSSGSDTNKRWNYDGAALDKAISASTARTLTPAQIEENKFSAALAAAGKSPSEVFGAVMARRAELQKRWNYSGSELDAIIAKSTARGPSLQEQANAIDRSRAQAGTLEEQGQAAFLPESGPIVVKSRKDICRAECQDFVRRKIAYEKSPQLGPRSHGATGFAAILNAPVEPPDCYDVHLFGEDADEPVKRIYCGGVMKWV